MIAWGSTWRVKNSRSLTIARAAVVHHPRHTTCQDLRPHSTKTTTAHDSEVPLFALLTWVGDGRQSQFPVLPPIALGTQAKKSREALLNAVTLFEQEFKKFRSLLPKRPIPYL